MRIDQKNIFLIDALGANVTILCLLILTFNEDIFGMPKRYLLTFMTLGGIFSIYSVVCYFTRPLKWKKYLKIIAALNFLYCMITVTSIFQNSQSLTKMGYTYFILELLVILALVAYEMKLVKK